MNRRAAAPAWPRLVRRRLESRVARLLFIWLGLLSPLLSGCHGATGSTAEAPPQVVAGPWEYRWGDSPRDRQGRLLWALGDDTVANQLGWQASGSDTQPPGRAGSRYQWMRTRLPGPAVNQPTLYFLIVEQIFEAYLDGQRIYHFGNLEAEGADSRRFLGNRTHMIALPPGYAGKLLTLRIYSQEAIIGISGKVRIGTAQAIIGTMVREDVGDAAVGVVLCAVGMLAIGLFLLQRTDAAYLYYGCFAFSMGLWLLCQMGSRSYIVDAPLGWLTVEIFALYAAVAFLVRYVVQVFGPGPLGLARILSRLLFAYLVGAAVLVSVGAVSLVAPLVPFRILLLVGIAYTLLMMATLSLRGHAEARLFAAGFLVSALFGIHDMLAVHGLLPRYEISFSQVGQGVFVICLGMILAGRFRRVHLTLAMAEKTLSEKVSQLEERNQEVGQLNDDLRRQIEARSKDLAASILDASSSFSELAVHILSAGSMIADRYRVLRLIGQGGMGAVYEVERITDGRHLAAKVLSVQAGRQVLARFAREAQLLAKLRHPNLVTIQDVDMTQSHLAYIVMELVHGQSLAAYTSLARDLAFATKVLYQTADALATVHAQGIVHRDLKPDNVLIQNAEALSRLTVKLVDFGVSMILEDRSTKSPIDDASAALEATLDGSLTAPPNSPLPPTLHDRTPLSQLATSELTTAPPTPSIPNRLSNTARERLYSRPAALTQTGVIMGTPLYMAPELRLGAKLARPASDVFSFGVMAYELIAGELPSEQPALFLVFRKDRSWFPRLHSKRPDVPGALAEIVERCLEPDPEKRPTALEIKAVLSAL